MATASRRWIACAPQPTADPGQLTTTGLRDHRHVQGIHAHAAKARSTKSSRSRFQPARPSASADVQPLRRQLQMIGAGLRTSPVGGQGADRYSELHGQPGHSRPRRGWNVLGHEPQPGQRAQLHGKPELRRRAPRGPVDPGHSLRGQREVLDQLVTAELHRPGLQLAERAGAVHHSLPRCWDRWTPRRPPGGVRPVGPLGGWPCGSVGGRSFSSVFAGLVRRR